MPRSTGPFSPQLARLLDQVAGNLEYGQTTTHNTDARSPAGFDACTRPVTQANATIERLGLVASWLNDR
jgi:hypothetical protein